jgi:hypothetical protein
MRVQIEALNSLHIWLDNGVVWGVMATSFNHIYLLTFSIHSYIAHCVDALLLILNSNKIPPYWSRCGIFEAETIAINVHVHAQVTLYRSKSTVTPTFIP